MPPYKHLSQFKDRNGLPRVYLRVPGCRAIKMPLPIGSPEFEAAYHAGLKNAVKKNARRAAQAAKGKAAGWSGRRLQAHIAGIMGETGVYILMRRGKVAYVGSSKNCAARIKSHRQACRPFDKAFYIFAEEHERYDLERILIAAINPPQNKIGLVSPNPEPGGSQGLEENAEADVMSDA